ncbi:MAG: PspC domain-containing protein [Bacteroidia bacterium]|nr:PspC domain-containing protein [Bacteroidia bacterium]
MKRTEPLNIGGFAFNVEEDAAEALRTYLDSIKKEFESDGSANEICSDIEERIGELLLEKSNQSRIVTMSMVDYAKSVMGEFGGTSKVTESMARESEPNKRRLYRDIDNKFLGGVFSGLAAYTNLDVVIYRISFTVLLVLGAISDMGIAESLAGMLVVAYIILWICIPAANTVEQKCQLEGKPIYASDFSRAAGNSSVAARRDSKRSETPAVHAAGRVVLIFIGIIMILWGSASAIGCCTLDMIPKIVHHYVYDRDALEVIDTVFSTDVTFSLAAMMLLFAAWSIYAGVLLVFNLNAPKWRPGLILFVMFMLALLVFTVFAVRAALDIPMLF